MAFVVGYLGTHNGQTDEPGSISKTQNLSRKRGRGRNLFTSDQLAVDFLVNFDFYLLLRLKVYFLF